MTGLSSTAMSLLADIRAGRIVRMPEGRAWNVLQGRYLRPAEVDALRELLSQCFVRVSPAGAAPPDHDYVLTDAGAAALAAARSAATPTDNAVPSLEG